MGVKGKWARIWIDTLEATARTASLELATEVAMVDATALEEPNRTMISIGYESRLGVDGYLENIADNAGGLDRSFSRRFGVDNLSGVDVCAAAMFAEDATNEQGMPCYILPITYIDDLKTSTPLDNVMTINGEFFSGRGGLRRGLLVHNAAVATTGIKATIQFPSAAAGGGQAFLFVPSVTGITGTAIITVASSATNNGTFVNHATFNFTNISSQMATMAGPVNQWIRVSVSDMGGASAIRFALMVCLNGVTQPA